MDERDRLLDQLLSERAIARVILDYGRGCDRGEEQTLRDCFWPDATVAYGVFSGPADAFVDFAMTIIRPLKFAAHHISNICVEVRGEAAEARCYYFAHQQRAAGDGLEEVLTEGRYVDVFERRGGAWKIKHRNGLRDFTRTLPGAVHG